MNVAGASRDLKAPLRDADLWLSLKNWLLAKGLPQKRIFLQVKFNEDIADRPGYTQYNYDSPWLFPIRLIDKKREAAINTAHSGPGLIASEHLYQTAYQKAIDETFGYRVEAYGEVPDFAWYQETFSNDYSNGQDLSASADKNTDKLAKPGAK